MGTEYVITVHYMVISQVCGAGTHKAIITGMARVREMSSVPVIDASNILLIMV